MDHIPPVEASGKKSLLVVVLGSLSGLTIESLVRHIQNSSPDTLIQTWIPSRSLLQSIARPGRCRDSRANLYAVAMLVHRSGRSHFVVADELANRQLTGTCRVGEDTAFSIIIAMLHRSSPTTTARDLVRVIARRATILGDEKASADELLRVLGSPESLAKKRENHQFGIDLSAGTEGLVLYDPDCDIFPPNDLASLRWENYHDAVISSLSTPPHYLPAELRTKIIALADQKATNSPMPVWERRQSEEHLILFLLASATEHQLAQTQNMIQQQLQGNGSRHRKRTVELIPYERHYIRTRRDLYGFWNQYRLFRPAIGTNTPPLYILEEPIHRLEMAQFGSLSYDNEGFLLVARTSLDKISQEMASSAFGFHQVELQPSHPKDAIRIYDPDQPFYSIPPPWIPAVTPGKSHYYTGVFYLTNRLTVEQDERIRAQLETESAMDAAFLRPKKCCYVPWESDTDADSEALWRIAWAVYTESIDYGCFFCIDQQSAIDLTALMVIPDSDDTHGRVETADYPRNIQCPELRGFHTIRVPGLEAHVIKVSFDMGGAIIEEFENVRSFRRPDWPSKYSR